MEIRSIIDIGLSLGYTMETLQRVNRILDNLDKPKNFRRLSKWHFQTKPLPAGNAEANLPSLLASKSSLLPGDLPTNPNGVPNVVRLARVSSEITGTPTGQPERCIQQFALSAGRTPWYRLGPVVTNPCIVAIALAR